MTEKASERPAVDPRTANDHRVEQVVGRLLQVGVLVAAAVVLVGGIGLLLTYGGMPTDCSPVGSASCCSSRRP